MKGFSPFDKNGNPTAGEVVGDIDNKLGDAMASGDMKAARVAFREVKKDINSVIKSGGEEELTEYINLDTFRNFNTYSASFERDNRQKEE